MAAKPMINWLDPRKGRNIDGSTLPSDTGVLLSSRNHLEPPGAYVVYRLIPKPFWRFWGMEREEETSLEAREDGDYPAALGGKYYSEPIWNLPAPPNQSGCATFRAWTDTGDASSGILGSARIWLEEMSTAGRAGADIGANISAPAISIGPKLSRGRDFERHWRVRVTEDPWVEISLLQAEAVIDHLRELEEEYDGGMQRHRGMWELPADTTTYFVDHPLADISFTYRLEPREPLAVTVQVPDRPDLRAAICLQVHNLEDDSLTITPPIFLTNVRDRLIATDLTVGMLRSEPRDLLVMLDEAQLNVERVAERQGLDVATTWSQLVAATQELGASSVSDAAFFVGLSTPMYA